MSGVRFLTKDNLCTRFTTKLILRRGLKVNVTVGIAPGKDRSEEERATLLTFKFPEARIKDFPSLVEAAKDAIGLNISTKVFSNDILRVEVIGPN